MNQIPERGFSFAQALTMLGLFCFHHFLRSFGNDSSQEGGSPKPRLPVFVMLGMTVLRGVEAHSALTMLGIGQKIVF